MGLLKLGHKNDFILLSVPYEEHLFFSPCSANDLAHLSFQHHFLLIYRPNNNSLTGEMAFDN
jgi:hypothetical protein